MALPPSSERQFPAAPTSITTVRCTIWSWSASGPEGVAPTFVRVTCVGNAVRADAACRRNADIMEYVKEVKGRSYIDRYSSCESGSRKRTVS